MEEIMSKTNDTSSDELAETELQDNELDAVTGGTKGGPVTLRDLAKILGELEQAQAGNVR
jgi:hypothetical protein